MRTPNRYSLDNLLGTAAIQGRNSVKTQYACQVVHVSDDGRFVDVMHNTLEYVACPDGDTVMINEYGQDVLCAAVEPWVIADVPVEQPNLRGQWDVRVRPRVGDRGILSVFYHDTSTLKEKGGFQAPSAIRVMVLDSASWRPGLPNHADVNKESDSYPDDNEWELKGNGVKVKLTSPVDENSPSPNKMDVTVGSVQFTITVPKDGTPTVNFNAPDGAITVNAKTANVNLTESATLTTPKATVIADTSVTIDTPATTITGTLQVDGAITANSTLTVAGPVTALSTAEVVGALTVGSTIVAAGAITAPSINVSSMSVPGSVSVGDTLSVTGAITSSSTITATGDVIGAGKSLSTHKHGGVTSGTSETGTPV